MNKIAFLTGYLEKTATFKGGLIDILKAKQFKLGRTQAVDLESIVNMGTTLVSSQMNQMCTLFLVDVTGLTPTETEADVYNAEQEAKDSDEFKHNKVMWLDSEELMDNGDWKSIYIMAQLLLNEPKW